jgi:TolB-like protein/DNA-binding winged helix-turn-helix (wHTH) protein/Tfp pilus assembly protein PilF
MSIAARQFYQFGPYRIDPDTHRLLRGEQLVPLTPKALETLLVLVRHSGAVVSKDELMKQVWPDTFVEEANLAQHIALIRKALGETAQSNRYIVTLPGRGYRFTERVRLVSAESISSVSHPPTQAPDGRKISRWVWGIGSVLLTVALIVGLVVTRSRIKSFLTPKRVMLAVLPFENLSGDPQQEYFSDGLTEETITDLGELNPQKLGVIARTSMMRYKHTDKPLDQIGHELGVDYILEGSARKDTQRIRISAQLIRVKDQTHVWAQSYDRDVGNLLEVQKDLGAAIAQHIQISLAPQKNLARITDQVDPEVYDDFLKGEYLRNKFNPEAVKKSIEFYQQALERNPTYAPAYAGLAESYEVLLDFSVFPPNEAYPRSEAAARKAVELGPENSECHAAFGWQLLAYDRDFAGAKREFRRAIELNPSNSEAHEGLAWYLAIRKQFDASLSEVRKAQGADPLSPIMNADIGNMLFYSGRGDEAIQQLRAAISLDPDFPASHYYLIKIYQSRGSYEGAFQEFVNLQSIIGQFSKEKLSEIKSIHAKSGWKPALQDVLATMLRERSGGKYVSAYDVAELQLAVGEDDKAIDWLEKAADEHANQVIFLHLDPRFEGLHSNPRFQNLLRRVGV